MKKTDLTPFSDIPSEKIDWLWEPYIPFGKITILQGDPGAGKTLLGLKIAAACSTGYGLPGMRSFPQIKVIYQSAEDGLGDTLKPRLEKEHANLDNIFNIREDESYLDFDSDKIKEAILQTGARLVIFDPIQGYIGPNVNMNRANEVRAKMHKLVNIATATGCAILLIGHLNKASKMSSAYRGLGSIDFRATVRSVLTIGKIPTSETRVIAHDKSSLIKNGDSLGFTINDDGTIHWVNGYEKLSSDDLLHDPGSIGSLTKQAQAKKFIEEMLSHGEPIYSKDIFSCAKELGISHRTVLYVKERMENVISKKIGDLWYWCLNLPISEEELF